MPPSPNTDVSLTIKKKLNSGRLVGYGTKYYYGARNGGLSVILGRTLIGFRLLSDVWFSNHFGGGSLFTTKLYNLCSINEFIIYLY